MVVVDCNEKCEKPETSTETPQTSQRKNVGTVFRFISHKLVEFAKERFYHFLPFSRIQSNQFTSAHSVVS